MSNMKEYSEFCETSAGFMVKSSPSELWKRLTPGQKLLWTLYEQGKIQASQAIVDLFNQQREEQK